MQDEWKDKFQKQLNEELDLENVTPENALIQKFQAHILIIDTQYHFPIMFWQHLYCFLYCFCCFYSFLYYSARIRLFAERKKEKILSTSLAISISSGNYSDVFRNFYYFPIRKGNRNRLLYIILCIV